MTREAVAAGADFVIWPESSVPFMFEEDIEGAKTINGLVQEMGTPILLGSNQLERGPPARLYNAAFFVTPGKKRATVYRKIHLVPFGEYIPFRNWLFFVSPLVDGVAEFAPGTSTTMLPLGNHSISTAICYEVVYPALSQEAVQILLMMLGMVILPLHFSTSILLLCVPSSKVVISLGLRILELAGLSIRTDVSLKNQKFLPRQLLSEKFDY